ARFSNSVDRAAWHSRHGARNTSAKAYSDSLSISAVRNLAYRGFFSGCPVVAQYCWQDGTGTHGSLPPAIRVSQGGDSCIKRHLGKLLPRQAILAMRPHELYGTQLGRRFSLVRGLLPPVQLGPAKYQPPPDVGG